MPKAVQSLIKVLRVAAWFLVAASILLVIFAAVPLLIPNAGAYFILVGIPCIISAIICLVLATIAFRTVKEVPQKTSSSRTTAIVLGILLLPAGIIGTVLGVLVLVYTFDADTKNWFSKAR